jgi:hypothetical protein
MEGKARVVVTLVLLGTGILVFRFLDRPRTVAPDAPIAPASRPTRRAPSLSSSPAVDEVEAKRQKARAEDLRTADLSLLVDVAASRYRNRLVGEIERSMDGAGVVLECENAKREPMIWLEAQQLPPYEWKGRLAKPPGGFAVLSVVPEPPTVSPGSVVAWQGAFRCVLEYAGGRRAAQLVYFPVGIVEADGHRRLSPGTEKILDDPSGRFATWTHLLSEEEDAELQRRSDPYAPTATPAPAAGGR